ncbi:MAG: hypothetical protein MJD61_14965 [Proteobacteria bacterium]|nr:hypothetical protein [Pseudomonadota bacterium]
MRTSSIISGWSGWSAFSGGYRGRASGACALVLGLLQGCSVEDGLRSEAALAGSTAAAEGAAGNDRAESPRSLQHAVRALAGTKTVDSPTPSRSEEDDRAQMAQTSGPGDPPGFRWIWADPHIHTAGCNQGWPLDGNTGVGGDPVLSPVDILAAMQKRGLDVGDVLVWAGTGAIQGNPSELKEWQQITGNDYDSAGAGYPGKILHYDLEVSRWLAERMGHITVLGLDGLPGNFDQPCGWGSTHYTPVGPLNHPSTWYQPIPGTSGCPWELDLLSGLEIVQWSIAQGADVIGINHTGNWSIEHTFLDNGLAPLELPAHVGLSSSNSAYPPISFMAVETSQLDPGGFSFHPQTEPIADVLGRAARQLWSDFLNSGYRMGIVGASDNRCFQRQVGQLRTGVLVSDVPLTFQDYLNALKLGRTQAVYGQGTKANLDAWVGPSVAHVGGVLAAFTAQVVNFGVWTDLEQNGKIELLVNGQVWPGCQWDGFAGQQQYHVCAITVGSGAGQLNRSSWVSVRAPRVQTSSIYLHLNSQSIRPSVEAPCRMVKHLDALIANGYNTGIPALCPDGNPCSTPGCASCCSGGQACKPTHTQRYETARHQFKIRAADANLQAGNGWDINVCDPPERGGPADMVEKGDPGCPSNDEVFDQDFDESGPDLPQDYYDYHFGPFLQGLQGTVTGRLDPHVGTAQSPHTQWLQPDPFGTVECQSPPHASCPDYDRFSVGPVVCAQGQGDQYLRARASLRTEIGVKDGYELRFCWSKPPNITECPL